MTAIDNVDTELLTYHRENIRDIELAKEDATWNSFAVTTNGLLPTESEKVGVALEDAKNIKLVKVYTDTKNILLNGASFGLYSDENT